MVNKYFNYSQNVLNLYTLWSSMMSYFLDEKIHISSSCSDFSPRDTKNKNTIKTNNLFVIKFKHDRLILTISFKKDEYFFTNITNAHLNIVIFDVPKEFKTRITK